MDFKQFNLDSRLNTGIHQAGYTQPTEIQKSAIPLALAGSDLIGTAQTGTGKTAAFVLPILHNLLNKPRNKTGALIITPTRELAEQIHQTIRDLAKGTDLKSVSIYGGVGAGPQLKALRRGVEIVVACPGRLLDLMQNQGVRLNSVGMLVLDEADRMLDMGFLPDIKRILKQLPNQRQTMLFSATFPKEIEQLARDILRNPQRVSIGIARPANTVSHTLYPVSPHLKKDLLFRLLEDTRSNSVLIFTRTKHRAKNLSKQLGHEGYAVTSLHGNRSQNQRASALSGFKKGQFEIMVATDIAARGLDIESISHVINFDMPDTPDAYIHRIGRTGRAERNGEAITLSTPEDGDLIRRIEKIMGEKLPVKTIAGFNYDKPQSKPQGGSRAKSSYAKPASSNGRSYNGNGKPKTSNNGASNGNNRPANSKNRKRRNRNKSYSVR